MSVIIRVITKSDDRAAGIDLFIMSMISNGNRTKRSPIRSVIVSITKFSIVIGSPRAY